MPSIASIEARVMPARSVADADALQSWLESVLAGFSQRILPVKVSVATRWGRLCDAHSQLPTDMRIAATALEHGLTVATRNVGYFRRAHAPLVNPEVS